MASRRQLKVASVVKEIVSETFASTISDPRIKGFISVTEVDVAANLKSADVFFSIFGVDEKKQVLTFEAIEDARDKVQSILASEMRSRYCPKLTFHMDQKIKKTLETLKIIDQVSSDLDEKEEKQEGSE